jgi:3-phosphoshikimate 1-carboxyvinyltransferase
MLKSLGADASETKDGLIVRGKKRLPGGTVDSCNDHRIAMSAAVAAAVCGEPVVIEGAECTEKSFPGFWEKLKGLEISE